MRARVAAALAVAVLAVLLTAPAAQAWTPRIHWQYRAIEATDGSGVIKVWERKCLRFRGERFCARWHYRGSVVR